MTAPHRDSAGSTTGRYYAIGGYLVLQNTTGGTVFLYRISGDVRETLEHTMIYLCMYEDWDTACARADAMDYVDNANRAAAQAGRDTA